MAGIRNPFSNVASDNLPNAMPGIPAQHGSSEPGQPSSYFDTMGGDTPTQTPRNTSPRRSYRARARSTGPAAQEDQDYEARRDERRDTRRDEGIGAGFRITACEQTLRSHNDELAAQRLMLKQLTEAVEKLVVDRDDTTSRLNAVFALVDQRFTEAQDGSQAISKVAHEKFETLTATMQSIAHEIVQKIEIITKDVDS